MPISSFVFVFVTFFALMPTILCAANPGAEKLWVLASTKNAYPDGFPSASTAFTYDANGRVLRVVERNGSEIVVVQRAYVYKNESTTEILTLDPANQLRVKTIQEFATGLLLREKVQDAEGAIQSKSDYRYDAKGRKIAWELSNSLTASTTTEYSFEGDNLNRTVVLDSSKALIKRYDRNYDNEGRLLRTDEYDGRGNLMRTIFYTWKSGLLTKEETRDSKGSPQKSISYFYDVAGHPVKLEFYNKRGELTEVQIQEWVGITPQSGVRQ